VKKSITVAVLGAGIMGATTAMFLARKGVHVILIDAAKRPFDGASRWNEGKIHLGHLYAADPGLQTAKRLLPGGLAFKRLTESLIATSLDGAVTVHSDTYLTHRDSVVDAGAMAAYLHAVTALASEHPEAKNYLVDLRGARAEPLSKRELEATYATDQIVAGFKVPERSIDTQWLADRFTQALAAESGIEQRLSTRITGVQRLRADESAPLFVDTEAGREGPFDFVVNALWEGRLAIDATMALPMPTVRTHRFRLSVFARSAEPLIIPSTVVATGPFGDVKSYGERTFYLSWYPAGLAAEGNAIAPPASPRPDAEQRDRIIGEVLDKLGEIVPTVGRLAGSGCDLCLEGGWVYAQGEGSLADEKSTLHRRDRIGIQRSGSYFSVDTGKYSIAPWLAQQIADAIVHR
jgi:glycine/D-amino acid oxidase-like deaminating enzyme